MIIDEESQLKSNPSTTTEIFDAIQKLRNEIRPELEYVAGAIATYLFLVALINPELLPIYAKPVFEIIDKLPLSKLSIASSATIAFMGSVDGASRIVLESLPFYKAYLQVFLLNKIE